MDKLAAAVDVAMKSPQVSDRLKAQGIEPVGGTRASFNEFVDAERARLGSIVKASNMKDE
jgi:tripartite-type tricarboxylate transporter receptor subunit TctC